MSLRPTGVLLRCPVLPSTGTSPDYPMSQKATTEALAGKVPTSRTINGKPLSSNLTLNSTDVSALPLTGGTITGQTTFKVNGETPKIVVERPDTDTNISMAFKGKTKTLHFGKGPDGHLYYAESGNIAAGAKLYSSSNKPTAAELGLPSSESFTTELGKKVDKTITVNGKPLSANISLTAADIGALPSGSNAVSATKLATPRNINGTAFDGTAAITTVQWGAARTITIGSTGKSVNGASNVSWTLTEIGAAPATHKHDWADLNDPPATATRWPNWTEVTGKPETSEKFPAPLVNFYHQPITLLSRNNTFTNAEVIDLAKLEVLFPEYIELFGNGVEVYLTLIATWQNRNSNASWYVLFTGDIINANHFTHSLGNSNAGDAGSNTYRTNNTVPMMLENADTMIKCNGYSGNQTVYVNINAFKPHGLFTASELNTKKFVFNRITPQSVILDDGTRVYGYNRYGLDGIWEYIGSMYSAFDIHRMWVSAADTNTVEIITDGAIILKPHLWVRHNNINYYFGAGVAHESVAQMVVYKLTNATLANVIKNNLNNPVDFHFIEKSVNYNN